MLVWNTQFHPRKEGEAASLQPTGKQTHFD